jgi:NAD+ diphosphatase
MCPEGKPSRLHAAARYALGAAMTTSIFDRPFTPTATGFIGSAIARDDAIRRDPEALRAARMDPRARWLIFDDLKPVMDVSGELDLLWLPREELHEESLSVFLGLDGDAPRFAAAGSTTGDGRKVIDARSAAAQLGDGRSAVLAHARSLIDWHQRHGFCPSCGAETLIEKAGYARRCGGCGTEHFPRTDPVVIMLPVHEDKVLMGRQPQFPEGMLSALAGFLEPGESIEEAVAREVFEEVGVKIGRVAYVASQPWPFPSLLMIGAFAEALTTEIRLDETELAEARWVGRAEVEAAMRGEGSIRMPHPLAIAHTLLATWLQAT